MTADAAATQGRRRSSARLAYIDWYRGIAVLIMIAWHSIDAWAIQTGRDVPAFQALAFLAGWAAPMFLFLAGVSVALGATGRLAKGGTRGDASWAMQKRGWQIFLLAHLFRFQSFVLNPHAQWNGLLKPDILNILGLGIVLSAWLWQHADTGPRRIWWILVPTAVIVLVLTPWSRTWWWPTLLHPRLEAYIRPVRNLGQFTLFPTIGYVLAGAFTGMALADRARQTTAGHIRLAVAGLLVLGLAGLYWFVPWPRVSWGDSATLFLARVGTMTIGIALSWFAWLHRRPDRWSPLVILGRTSLVVYWVHVEIAYGLFGYPLRHTLSLPWAFLAYGVLTLLMVGLGSLWLRRSDRLIPQHMKAGPDGARATITAPPALA
jgi:uncharacterized membrane protein